MQYCSKDDYRNYVWNFTDINVPCPSYLCVYALVYEKPYINVFGLLISAPMNCFSSEVLWNNMEFIIIYTYKMFNADIILNCNEMF